MIFFSACWEKASSSLESVIWVWRVCAFLAPCPVLAFPVYDCFWLLLSTCQSSYLSLRPGKTCELSISPNKKKMHCIRGKYLAYCIYLLVRTCCSDKVDFVWILLSVMLNEWIYRALSDTETHFICFWGNWNINYFNKTACLKCLNTRMSPESEMYLEYILWSL